MKVKDTRGLKSEIRLVPGWAYAVAVVLFFAILFLFYRISGLWSPESDAPYVFRVFVSVFPGTMLAFLALMAGYVNRDAGRRGMSRTLWTILVLVIPNAIGFILYFLLRTTVRVDCPKCGTMLDPGVNFCPRCRYSFHPTCAQCRSTVKPEDTFCSNCGAQINHVA